MFWLFVDGELHSSAEMEREVATREKAVAQRDEALNFLREQLLPLVASFTTSTGALLPMLEQLVSRQEQTTAREDTRDREARRDR
ncbi:MAG: hypothetical protein ACRDOU_21685 [Streptosporangiaceae bacterium]